MPDSEQQLSCQFCSAPIRMVEGFLDSFEHKRGLVPTRFYECGTGVGDKAVPAERCRERMADQKWGSA